MFAGILGFEWRYQRRNPVFWVAIVIFFWLAGVLRREGPRQGAVG